MARSRRIRTVTVALAAAGALGAVGVGVVRLMDTPPAHADVGPTSTGSPVGVWQVEDFSRGNEAMAQRVERSRLTVTPDGDFSIATECNHILGVLRIDGGTPALTVESVTAMYCDGDRMDVEAAIASALRDVTRWSVDKETMVLTDASGAAVFTFTAVPLTVEGSWQVRAIAMGPILSMDALAANMSMVFANGTVSGSTGCNSFTGTYTQDGDRLTLAVEVVEPAAVCAPEVAAAEQRFLTALGAVKGLGRGGLVSWGLALTDGGDAVEALLAPA